VLPIDSELLTDLTPDVSVKAGMLCSVVTAGKSPFGRLILVSGPEGLLADRAVAELSQQMRSEAPDVEISEIEATGSIAARSSRSPGVAVLQPPCGRYLRHRECGLRCRSRSD
jgi:hypothetical protein